MFVTRVLAALSIPRRYAGEGASISIKPLQPTASSVRSCLAPASGSSSGLAFAHAERFQMGYRRPTDLPDVLLDEAETSLRASFTSLLSPKDREDLVEDARDRLIQWLALRQHEGETDAQS